ncbi:MAG: HAMP domain-containing histidine kinase [Ottowia sp.]|nr:MAG: HAMP domain-containing histidine kinase [Ottowia sp.]
MNLNLATAAFFSALAEFSLCIGMLVLWAREKARYLIYWSSGFLAFGLGSLLISLRDKIPDFFSIVVANFSTTFSSVLFYIGICLFFDRRRSWLFWMVAVLGLEAASLAYYTYVTYDTPARVYVYSAAQTFIMLATLLTLFKAGRERGKTVNPEVMAVTLLFLVVHAARIIGSPFFPAPRDFLASGNFQVLLSFGLQVIHIGYGLVFGNMHAFALNAKLSAALTDAQAKDRQKVEALGYVGHDLRAPLATISGYCALLLAEAHEQQRKLLQTIERSVKYQLDLIDELLEFAKGELQPLAVRPVATELPRLLDDVSEYAIALCARKNNHFCRDASGPMPRQIVLDGKRLQQVLLNLLSNAAKFTRDGVVTLSVTAEPEGDACILRVAVSDTGVGIDLSQGVDIFGAFQRIQAAGSSTGLGLFIAQRLVSAMGGSLSVASVSGQGSTFSFVLSAPVIDASGSGWTVAAPRETEPRGPSRQPTASGNVLLDDPALDELAGLALHGRLTDIERWIDRHADEAAHAPFLAQLRELLEQFDFAAIHALALGGQSKASDRGPAAPHE